MVASRAKSGVTEYTTTTGSGALTLTGAAAGFRGFVSADDGLTYPYSIFQAGIAFEVGEGVYTHASRQLTRATVLANINGTTVPLQLGSGTKEVSIVLPGERVAMLNAINQFAADQVLNGNRLCLDEGDTWIDSATDDNIKVYVNSLQVADWYAANGLTYFHLMASNDTATEAPNLVLRRASGSPAALDRLASIHWQAADSSLTPQLAARISAYWQTPAAGTFASVMDFMIANAGALQTVLALRPSMVSVPTGVTLFTAGKTVFSTTVAGTELYANGAAQIVCLDGNTPLHLCRGAGDGTYLSFYSNGVAQGDIHVTSGSVSVGAFTGNHYGDFAAGVGAEHEQVGTVLAGTGSLLEAASSEPFYELVPAVAGDRRVLGVYGGRRRTGIMGGPERDLIVLWGLGNGRIRAAGPIAAGDLLWASDQPGVAEKQPNQDQVGPWTVAKATNDSPVNGGERLVSCVYMAG